MGVGAAMFSGGSKKRKRLSNALVRAQKVQKE
jgi:hypothetical protein